MIWSGDQYYRPADWIQVPPAALESVRCLGHSHRTGRLEIGLLGDLCPSGTAAEGPVRYITSVYTFGHLSLDQKCTCDATPHCSYFPCISVHMEPSQSPQALPSSDETNRENSLCFLSVFSLQNQDRAWPTGCLQWQLEPEHVNGFPCRAPPIFPCYLPVQRQATFSQMILKDSVLSSWNPLAWHWRELLSPAWSWHTVADCWIPLQTPPG